MFYWTWHTDFVADGDGKPVQNITETLRKYPEAAFDYNHPAWKHGTCFWEQPLFGYYRTTDPWVLRKHAEMLADAGVDVVFFRLYERFLHLEIVLRCADESLGSGPEGRRERAENRFHAAVRPASCFAGIHPAVIQRYL